MCKYKTILLLLFIAGTCQAQYEVRHREVPEYDTLPASYRERVSRAEYERINKPFSVDDIAENERAVFEKRMQIVLGDAQRFEKTAKLLSSPEIAGRVGLVREQQKELDSLIEWRNQSLEEIRKKYGEGTIEFSREKRKIDTESIQKGSEILAAFQITELSNIQIGYGLPKILTKSVFGEALMLDEGQLDEIKAKCKDLHDEIAEFERKKRIEAARIVFGALDESQRQIVLEYFEARLLDDINEKASLSQLKEMHNLEGSKASPGDRSKLRIWDKKR